MNPAGARNQLAFAGARILAVSAFLCLGVSASPQNSAKEDIEIIGDGAAAVSRDLGAAEEEAVWDAKRNAVERAAGIFLRARAIGRDFQIESDDIEGRTNGFIREWEVLPASRRIEALGGGRVLRLQVKATVALLPVIRKLSDIKDVYDDLERPRIRIDIANDAARRVSDALSASLKAEGFEISRDENAEVLLSGILEYRPTLRLGDRDSPYGVGEKLAACRARLSIRVTSTASEEVLITLAGQGAGRSFTSDSEARSDSAEAAADDLITQSRDQFRENLLVRWARERLEGHVVALQLKGMDARVRDSLRQQLAAMRGFRRFVSESGGKDSVVLRLLTRLDTRAIRRRLAELEVDHRSIAVLDHRGPTIDCAIRPAQRVSGR